MRNRISFIFSIALVFSGLVNNFAQVSLNVTTASACDSLKGSAFFSPSDVYDTVVTIHWFINNKVINTEDDSLEFSIKEPGIYKLKARINDVIEYENSFDLVVYPSPDARFSWTDSSVANFFNYEFISLPQEPDSLTYSYKWQVDNVLAGDLPILDYSFNSTGNYNVSLEVRSSTGCSDLYAEIVRVRKQLACPNAFTPNMDNRNDVFVVKTDGISNYAFTVFSRAGIKVFYSESPTISWDGRSMSGIEMQPGIYYYTIENRTVEDTEIIRGFVHLLR